MKTFLHFCRVLGGLSQPQTQVTSAERGLLVRAAQMSKSIVEIGCFEGHTAATLGASTVGVVHSIDSFTGGRSGICYGEWIARAHFARQGIRNVKLLKGLSHHVVQNFSAPVDLLFIDADHSYEGIRRDWDDWYPKVIPGGLVALHDCKLGQEHT